MAIYTLSPDKIQYTLNVNDYNNWDSGTLGRVLAGKINVQWHGAKTVRSAARITYKWPAGMNEASEMVIAIPLKSESSPGRLAAYLSTANLGIKQVTNSSWTRPSDTLVSGALAIANTPYSNQSCTKAVPAGKWITGTIYFKLDISKINMVANQTYYVYIVQDEGKSTNDCALYGKAQANAFITYKETPTDKIKIIYDLNGQSDLQRHSTIIEEIPVGTPITLIGEQDLDLVVTPCSIECNFYSSLNDPILLDTVTYTDMSSYVPMVLERWCGPDGSTTASNGDILFEDTVLTAEWSIGYYIPVNTDAPHNLSYSSNGTLTLDLDGGKFVNPNQSNVLDFNYEINYVGGWIDKNGNPMQLSYETNMDFYMADPNAIEFFASEVYELNDIVVYRPGYEFQYWCNQDGVPIDLSASFYTPGAISETIYAVWKPVWKNLYVNGAWKTCEIQVYDSKQKTWHHCVPMIYQNGAWKQYL